MLEGMSPGELAVLALGGVLALCVIVSTIGSAAEKIAKGIKAIKAPERQQNSEIEELRRRVSKLEVSLSKDEDKISGIKECNRVLMVGMLALLEHGINGNNIDHMQKAQGDVNNYLINH